MFALPDWRVDADDRIGAHVCRIAPEISAWIFAFAAAVHASPGSKRARAHDWRAVRHFKRKCCISRMDKAGEPGQRFRRHEFSLAPQLHAADYRGQVHVAAALPRAQQRALNLHRPR